MNVETIYALATPMGRSGVAVIRVSGPAAGKSLTNLVGGQNKVPSARQAALRILKNPATGEIIDEALVLFFSGPASFTGEDVAEYHIHGGVAVIRHLLEVLSQEPAHRMADPGEFTRRAFENGKLDLTAAEAIGDLIDAQSQLQKAQALAQYGGALYELYEKWSEALTKILAHIEADIEFPDEDLPEGILPEILPQIESLAREIKEHLADNRRGERLRDGVQVVVVGAPNAGKSSIVNCLAQRDVAIVSEYEGTTRDIIDVHMDLQGYPVILSDTAGLRPEELDKSGHDSIESEGINRALRLAEKADIRMLVFDATKLPVLNSHTKNLIDERALLVLNKSENHESLPACIEGHSYIAVSAKTGEGIGELLTALTDRVVQDIGTKETPSLTRQRHREAIEECFAALERAQADQNLPELIAEDLRLAIRYLGRVTGRVDVEDLLDVIFKDFCIGK